MMTSKSNTPYDPNVLIDFAREYLDAEDSVHTYIATHRTKGGFLRFRSQTDHIMYARSEQQVSCCLHAIAGACELVSADMSTVIATAKAMNRYERKNKWRKMARLPYGWCLGCPGEYGEDRVRRFFARQDYDSKCYQSTGRRYAWEDD